MAAKSIGEPPPKTCRNSLRARQTGPPYAAAALGAVLPARR
ncbi:hypothetical protein [Paractinoplanes brasiliensis]|nr:hypothetical protein [Actinoplanes brasiliensis]